MIKVVQVGLGPLGQKVVRYALERGSLEVVAAVDPAADKVGKDLGEVCGLDRRLGVIVAKDLESALKGKSAQVAILTTVSSVKVLEKQIELMAKSNLNVVSTCEELSYCAGTFPEVAARIDAVCKKYGIACVGTGVNPGFLMDYLPVVLTSVCQKVERLEVLRVQDATPRRIPFQQKIGAGLTLDKFKEKVKAGTLRHVGLEESTRMLADSIGWRLDDYTESLEPVIAETKIIGAYTPIEPGMARGVAQIGRGFVKGREVITLRFRAAVGEPESYDTIAITGSPNIKSTIPGGVNGDVATCAITVNAIRSILKAKPGLNSMLDIPVPGYYECIKTSRN